MEGEIPQHEFDQFFDFGPTDFAGIPDLSANGNEEGALAQQGISPLPCAVHPDAFTCDCQQLLPDFSPEDLDAFMQDVDLADFAITPTTTQSDFGSLAFDGSELPAVPYPSSAGSLDFTSTSLSQGVTEPSTANVTTANSPYTPYSSLQGIKRPTQPCDYCRSKRLECFITFVGPTPDVMEKSCNACKVLFRPCSFAPQPPGPNSSVRGYMDTLHQITEDVTLEQGGMTGVKPLITLGAKYRDVVNDMAERRPDKALNRFSRVTVQILRDWLDAHADHPYPTEEEKDELRRRTGLQRIQISNWLANARRRGKVRLQRCQSPSVTINSRLPSAPMSIPGSEKTLQDMTPLERWRHSPPENEAARHVDIAYAMVTTDFDEHDPQGGVPSKSNSITNEQRSNADSYSQYKVSKASSKTSSVESVRSWQSTSHASRDSHESRSSYNSFARRDHRRRRRRSGTPLTATSSRSIPQSATVNSNHVTAAAQATDTTPKKATRPFHCTFCTDTFNSKYDWSRHEKSLHLSLERWTCCPNGPVEYHTTPTAAGEAITPVCAYCLNADPTPEHVNTHNHQSSFDHSEALRTFYRKDHLRQHLRLVHSVPLQPHMEKWKSVLDSIKSRCGFCQDTWFTSWSERADHLAKHFRSGMTMKSWKGDWGFDSEIQKLVCNAIAPFLLANESKTPSPFSATAPATMRCGTLIKEIGEWSSKLKAQGTPITDEMIKRKAALILYDDDDGWNQTPADNPEWLTWCKKTFQIGQQETFTDPAGNYGAESPGVPREPWDFGDFASRQQSGELAAFTQGQGQNAVLENEGDDIFAMDMNDMLLD